ncbi:MAG: hypothetical protein LBC07_01525 [Elusimicrobiota bacterium]|jgi:hypothetical protein|nr:hypothetical protein [Elusimicrobiota bacterium]
MANKQISDLVELTTLADSVFFVGEDSISTKKLRAKVIQDYIRLHLFFNFYTQARPATSVTENDLLAISPEGDYPTQKITFSNFIDALNRINLLSRLPQLAGDNVMLNDLLKISDSANENLSKKITFADFISALNRLNLFADFISKTSLEDTDSIPLSDGAQDGANKRITGADLKASLGAVKIYTFSANPTFTEENLTGGSLHTPINVDLGITAITINSFQTSGLPIHIQFRTHATENCTMTLPETYLTCTPVPANPLQKGTFYEVSILNGIFAFSQGV